MTVATHNLAIGVIVGVLVAMILFARRVAHLTETHRELVEDADGDATAVYRGHRRAVLRLQQRPLHPVRVRRRPRPRGHRHTDSHIWDASTVAALDAITTKYDRKGKTVDDRRAQRLKRRPPWSPLRTALGTLTRRPDRLHSTTSGSSPGQPSRTDLREPSES